MKRYLIIVMNIVLILAVIGGLVFAIVNAGNGNNDEKALLPTAPNPTTVETQAVKETYPPDKKFKIGIIQHSLGRASKDCYEGFITVLNESGLLERTEIVYIVEDNDELCREKIQKLVDSGCDLLYTIGRFSSEAAANITQEVPIVFGAVNSPAEIGLVESNEAPGGNVTGVSSFTPCFEQIDLIPLLLPQAKSIAAIYSNTDANSVSQGIVASKEAEQIGISCEKYPVDTEADLKAALKKIKEAKIEVIYIPVDKFLSSHIDIFNEFSYENKIPVICGDQATLERGAFATSEINYNSIGRRAAELCDAILFGGNSPATLSVVYKHECNNIVNKEVMEKLGIKLPTAALDKVQAWEKES